MDYKNFDTYKGMKETKPVLYPTRLVMKTCDECAYFCVCHTARGQITPGFVGMWAVRRKILKHDSAVRGVHVARSRGTSCHGVLQGWVQIRFGSKYRRLYLSLSPSTWTFFRYKYKYKYSHFAMYLGPSTST